MSMNGVLMLMHDDETMADLSQTVFVRFNNKAFKRTHTHARTHARTHAHTNTNTHTNTPTRTHTHEHTNTNTHTHKHTHEYTDECNRRECNHIINPVFNNFLMRSRIDVIYLISIKHLGII